MKHTLALVLMVFGLVGCASFAPSTKVIEVSHNMEVTSRDASTNESYIWQTKIVKNYEDLRVGTDSDRAEAMSIETGEKFHIGNYPLGFFWSNKYKLEPTLIRNCEKLFKSKCITTRTNIGRSRTANDGESFFTFTARDETDTVFYKDFEDYKLRQANNELRQAQNKRTREINLKNKLAREKRLAKESAIKEEEEKKRIIIGLTQRCEEYGFTGESNISACIQREAQHDKELAMQKYELQKTRVALQQAQSQAQSRAYAQSLPPVVEEEEDLPFLIKFLGDVAIGVAENLADPAFQRDLQQQRQINELKANQNRDIYRNCRPNC
ncbi:hypothetical protein N9507_05745 [Gammaproteobacteria bacterium]|nr:hypothetical protein [Gammaproteobacteria bacterium]